MIGSDFFFGVITGTAIGFIWAAWVAYRAQERARAKMIQSFQAAKTEVLRLLETAQDITEIRITINDRDGELELETEEDPPAATSSRRPKDLH